LSWYRTTFAASAIAATAAFGIVGRPTTASAADPAPPQQSTEQAVTVARPDGQISVSDVSMGPGEQLQLTVTDTRERDPGWSVSVSVTSDDPDAKLGWKPSVQQHTPAFSDGDGTTYAQVVAAGPSVNPGAKGAGIEGAVLGAASRGHGLGIAVLGAKLTAIGRLGGERGLDGATVTVTII
jgi:hypothetical protein